MSFLLLMQFDNPIVQVVFITVAVLGMIGTYTAGFQVSYFDLAGQYSGLAFGISNGLAHIVSMPIPIMVSTIVGEEVSDADSIFDNPFFS